MACAPGPARLPLAGLRTGPGTVQFSSNAAVDEDEAAVQRRGSPAGARVSAAALLLGRWRCSCATRYPSGMPIADPGWEKHDLPRLGPGIGGSTSLPDGRRNSGRPAAPAYSVMQRTLPSICRDDLLLGLRAAPCAAAAPAPRRRRGPGRRRYPGWIFPGCCASLRVGSSALAPGGGCSSASAWALAQQLRGVCLGGLRVDAAPTICSNPLIGVSLLLIYCLSYKERGSRLDAADGQDGDQQSQDGVGLDHGGEESWPCRTAPASWRRCRCRRQPSCPD